MEKDKSRGIKHVKGKAKYRGHTTKNPKADHTTKNPKAKPSLESNWDRYVEPEENEYENKLNSSTDFALLSSLPITAGSYFQYKNEDKEVGSSSEEHGDNLFHLDLSMLHRSILTVPFYERMGIEKEYFKDDEIQNMNRDAEKNMEDYQNFIDTKLSQNDIKENEENTLSNIQTQDKTCVIKDNVTQTENSNKYNKELDEVLDIIKDYSDEQLQVIQLPSSDVTDSAKETKENLEQWLDDILDD